MNTGKDFELLVKSVYEKILKSDGFKSIDVQHNVVVEGKSGAKHQIDVFWVFEVAGITHKVAIECKDHGKSVEKGMMQEFAYKINDIKGVVGVFISSNGYQEGAVMVGSHENIIMLTLKKPSEITENVIKRIEFKSYVTYNEIVERFFELDEKWFVENNPNVGVVQINISGWNDQLFIYDECKEKICSFLELDERLPSPFGEKADEEKEHVFEFTSVYVESNVGFVKLKPHIKYRYVVRHHEIEPIVIDHQEIVEAVITNVTTNKRVVVHKRGEVFSH